jgi:hypothetical protein
MGGKWTFPPEPTWLKGRTAGTLSWKLRCGAAEDNLMAWQKVRDASPPIDRPVLIRTTENDEPVIAFLTADNVWYSGGALVQNSATVLGAVPTQWCEPDGEESL